MGAGKNKVFLEVGGRSILAWSLDLFESIDEVTELVLVAAASELEACRSAIAARGLRKPIQVVEGGAVRHESEFLGILALAKRIDDRAVDVVLVHDAVRPFASRDLIARLVAGSRREGGAVPGVAAGRGLVLRNATGIAPAPAGTWAAQTPQAFAAPALLDAHRRAARQGFSGTDTASVLEWAGGRVVVVPGSYDNIKITTADDLVRADQIARHRKEGGAVDLLNAETFGG